VLAASTLLTACAAAGPGDAGDTEHPFEILLAEANSGLAERSGCGPTSTRA
jgi:hypothetical protein